MKLKQWVDERVKEREESRIAIWKWVAEEAGVSFTLVRNAYNGMRISTFKPADAISRVTRRQVSVKDLCDES